MTTECLFFVSGVLLKLMSKWRRQFDGCEGNGDLVPPSPTIVATHFTILTLNLKISDLLEKKIVNLVEVSLAVPLLWNQSQWEQIVRYLLANALEM